MSSTVLATAIAGSQCRRVPAFLRPICCEQIGLRNWPKVCCPPRRPQTAAVLSLCFVFQRGRGNRPRRDARCSRHSRHRSELWRVQTFKSFTYPEPGRQGHRIVQATSSSGGKRVRPPDGRTFLGIKLISSCPVLQFGIRADGRRWRCSFLAVPTREAAQRRQR